jgi:hypothetical protein
MGNKNKDIRDRFVAKIKPFKRVEPVPKMSSVYTTFNEVLLDVRYSAFLANSYYLFFIDTHRLNLWRGKQRFVECCICGDENMVVFLPDDKIFEWFSNIEPNRKGHWFIKVAPDDERLVIKIGHGQPEREAREYLNRFDLISPIIPRPIPQIVTAASASQPAFEEVRAAILADGNLKGDSVHDRVIDMVAQIGEWWGHQPKKSYAFEPGSPYVLDVVWLNGGEIDLAVEIHDGGNETEAKDRLRQALRYGARKVVIVSVPQAIPRLKSVCQFEADLKQWLEIWSVSRVYTMYRNGREFFENFRPFRRRQRSDNVAEYD